jgi:hypothetical protein
MCLPISCGAMTTGETGQADLASRSVGAMSAAAARGTRLPGWVARPALQGLLAMAAYLATFIICYAFPLISHPGVPQVSQGGPDANFFVWMTRWWPYAISHGLNPLDSRQVGAPAGFSLAWTTNVPALAVLMAPVTAVLGPVASFNQALALAAPVSAWAAFLAARRLTGRFWAALAAGAVYGFSAYEIDETGAGHPNLAVIMLLPLIVYLVLIWRDQKISDRVFVCLLAVAIAAEFYVFSETFVDLTVLAAVSLLIGFAVARPAQRHTIVKLAWLAAIAWVAAVVLASPYLVYMLRHAPPSFAHSGFSYQELNLDVAGMNPPAVVLLLLVVLALALFAWSSRLTRLLVIMFVFIAASAVGPNVYAGTREVGRVPWAWLWSLPVARSAAPIRLVIFGNLVLAMAVAVLLATPIKDTMLAAVRWALSLAVVVVIVAYPLAGQPVNAIPAGSGRGAAKPVLALPAFISSGRYRDYLRPGEIVVVVSDRGNAGMLFQAETDFYFRLAGGFVSASFNDPSALPAPVKALMKPTPAAERKFRAYVRQAGIGAILVERAWSAPWMRVFSQMGLHGTAAGGVIVYQIG